MNNSKLQYLQSATFLKKIAQKYYGKYQKVAFTQVLWEGSLKR